MRAFVLINANIFKYYSNYSMYMKKVIKTLL